MKKADIERFQNGLASGTGDESATITDSDGNEREYNLIGAVNEMLSVFEEMEKYDLAWADLTQEQQDAVDRGQRAMQEQLSKLTDLSSTIGGNDGTVDLSNGNTVDLPNAASDVASRNVPSSASNS